MSEKILNVYEFQTENNQISYIYSQNKKKDYLGFDYYILSKNDSLEPIIYEAGNTLDILQSNNIKLNPIKKDSMKYQKFLLELNKVLNNLQKKEKATIRK